MESTKNKQWNVCVVLFQLATAGLGVPMRKLEPILEPTFCDMCSHPTLHAELFERYGCCTNCGYVCAQLNTEDLAYVSPSEWEHYVQDSERPPYGGAS